jgi:2-hydroxychromene-2-carboxylate isomerase
MTQIDYYFSVISPYAYLAGDRLNAIAQRHNAEVIYKPLDVIALFARTGGTAPKDRHSSRKEYRAQELVRQATKMGLKFTLQPAHWPVNQAPASYAFIAAQNAGGGNLGDLAHGITRACWAEERNITEEAVIRECLSGAGFDPDLAETGLLPGAEEYVANLEQAVAAGAFGSPVYILDNGQRFWGQDRLEDLDAHLAGNL